MFAWILILLFKLCGSLTLGWGWLVALFLLNVIATVALHLAFDN